MDTYRKRIIFGTTLLLSLILLPGCTDDQFGKNNPYGNEICFSVTDDGDWSKAVSGETRSGMPRHAGVCALTTESDTLYLSGTEYPGIDISDISGKRTRAEIVNANTLTAFGIYSFMNDNATPHLVNEKISRAGEVWSPTSPQYWPASKPVKFYSYAPYVKTASASQGITRLPYMAEDGRMLLDFTVPRRVEDQIDLMSGNPVTASASPCDIRLRHALTAIRFSTGRRMAPCTVKSIKLSGVRHKGTLDLESGLWETDSVSTGTYELTCGKTLAVSPGNDGFTAENVPLTGTGNDNMTLLLMPQVLDERSTITLTIEWEGLVKEFTCSLKGKRWNAGTTVTYRLSANPGIPVLILEVVDPATGYPLKTIRPGYAGGKKDYIIRSLYDPADGSEPISVPWKAQLFKDGQPTTVEEFNAQYGNLNSFPTSGVGGEEARDVITVLPYPDFSGGMSEHTRKLREATPVGSPDKPKNLADVRIYTTDPTTGPSQAPEKTINTANCYLVNAPGTYGIPLVYGNAIQNGAEFGYSYDFKYDALVNYVGNDISSPYITTDTREKYGKPKLVWSDQLNVISNVRLSESSTEAKKMIVFDVDQRNIRQCNAVVAITDTKGEVMWSWHIWVTDMTTTSEADYIPMPCSDTKNKAHHHYLFHTNVGHIYEGDVVSFITPELTIQYTQDLTGLHIPGNMDVNKYTITFQQESYGCKQNEYFLLYQFGRKDPFVPKIDKIYDGNNNEISTTNGTGGFPTFNTISEKVYAANGSYLQIKHTECMAYSIKHPEQFMEGVNEFNDDYRAGIKTYMWNITGSASEFGSGAGGAAIIPYKSVYDPCPVGCKLPIGDWLKQIVPNNTVANNKLTDLSVSWRTNLMGKQYTLFSYTYGGQSQEIFIYASGYRSNYGYWVDDDRAPMWYVWLGDVVSSTLGTANAIGGRIKSNGEPTVELGHKNFTNAYGVRPMHIEDKTHHFYD